MSVYTSNRCQVRYDLNLGLKSNLSMNEVYLNKTLGPTLSLPMDLVRIKYCLLSSKFSRPSSNFEIEHRLCDSQSGCKVTGFVKGTGSSLSLLPLYMKQVSFFTVPVPHFLLPVCYNG